MPKKKHHKKGMNALGLGLIVSVAILFVIATFVMAFGAKLVSQVGDSFTAGTVEANITAQGLTALSDLSEWLPTLVLFAIFFIVIGVLLVLWKSGRLG